MGTAADVAVAILFALTVKNGAPDLAQGPSYAAIVLIGICKFPLAPLLLSAVSPLSLPKQANQRKPWSCMPRCPIGPGPVTLPCQALCYPHSPVCGACEYQAVWCAVQVCGEPKVSVLGIVLSMRACGMDLSKTAGLAELRAGP